jgi:hypothetical protein
MDERIKKSRLQENKGMQRMGGTRTAMSGAGWSRKGDGRTDDHVVEFKRTDKKSISLKESDLLKVEQEAWLDNRIPLLGIQMAGRNYIVMFEEDWLEMRDGDRST